MFYQQTFWDEKIDKSKLGGFVYALVDPRYNQIFYIGKGGGLESQGNERPNHHLKEALEYRKHPERSSNRDVSKLKKILEIWNTGKHVELIILRRGMDANTTAHVEAAFIQTLNFIYPNQLTNVVEGFRNSAHGLIDKSTAAKLYAEPLTPLDGDIILWVFPIKNALKLKKTAFDSTIASWSVSPKNLTKEKLGYAIGIDENRISKVVIKMEGWAEDQPNQNGVTKKKRRKKWKIIGQDISHGEGMHFYEKNYERLLTKDYSQINKKDDSKNDTLGYWLNGNYLIVRVHGNEVHYLHGNKAYSKIQL